MADNSWLLTLTNKAVAEGNMLKKDWFSFC